MLPQMELTSKPPAEPTLMLTPQEKPPAPGLITRLFGQRLTPGWSLPIRPGARRTTGSARMAGPPAHAGGTGQAVLSTYIDGLSAHNMYEELSKHASEADLLLITSSQLALPSLRFSLEHPGA